MTAASLLGLDPAATGADSDVVTFRHRGEIVATLYCGDSYAIRPTLGFMDGDVFDPPYVIQTAGGGMFRRNRHTMDEIAAAGIDNGFDMAIVNPLLCGAVVSFCHNDQLAKLLHHVDGQFDRYVVCGWFKSNPMPVANQHYRPDSEPYVHAWNFGYAPTGDLRELRRFVVGRADPKLKKRFAHPTIKPPVVMDKILRNVAGRTICDPFMGTGSTGVAAVKAGKQFFGIERDRQWFEAAVVRIAEAVAALG